MRIRRWQDWLILVLSIWLLTSLWVLGYEYNAAGWNVLVTGAAITLLAHVALIFGRFWEDWVELVLGLWLVISPWIVVGFVEASHAWNAFLVGIAIAVLAAWSLAVYRGHERATTTGPATV